MSSSYEEDTESDSDQPQFSPRSGRVLMIGGGKPLGSGSASRQKKSAESEEIPTADSQPDDELVTDALTLFSDSKPKKGGRGREKNTAAELSDPENYQTPPHETTTQRDHRLQRIKR
jgi:hypothetical protein